MPSAVNRGACRLRHRLFLLLENRPCFLVCDTAESYAPQTARKTARILPEAVFPCACPSFPVLSGQRAKHGAGFRFKAAAAFRRPTRYPCYLPMRPLFPAPLYLRASRRLPNARPRVSFPTETDRRFAPQGI